MAIYSEIGEDVKIVTDIGCGKGGTIEALLLGGDKLRAALVLRLNIFLPYLREAKKFYHDVVRCDIRFLPLRPSSVDLILATNVIEHLDKIDGIKLLFEAEKLLGSKL